MFRLKISVYQRPYKKVKCYKVGILTQVVSQLLIKEAKEIRQFNKLGHISLFASPESSFRTPADQSIAPPWPLSSMDCQGHRGKYLTIEACQSNQGMDQPKSSQKLGKFISSFEKVPGPSLTQVNVIPGEQRISLSLFSLSLMTSTHPMCSCALSISPNNTLTFIVSVFSLPQQHVTIWLQQLWGSAADCVGSKGPSFNMKQKPCTVSFVWAQMRTQLDFLHVQTFSMWDRGRWEVGNAGVDFYPNILT